MPNERNKNGFDKPMAKPNLFELCRDEKRYMKTFDYGKVE